MALTPKAAFEAIQVLFPGTVRITPEHKKSGWRSYTESGRSTASSNMAPIDWGNITEYPLPEPKWRDARPGDVCQKGVDARFRDFDTNAWSDGILMGCDFSAEYAWKCKGVGQYKYCQVRDEA